MAAVGVVVGGASLAPGVVGASSHREAPAISDDRRLDNTDVYAFVSPDDPDSVTLIADWNPFSEPDGGPNFYRFQEGSNYDINIDNNGDAVADLTYRWVFNTVVRNPDTFLYNTGPVTTLPDEDLNIFQTYDLTLIRQNGPKELLIDDAPVAPSFVGPASMPEGYEPLREAATVPLKTGAGYSYAGQADDPFFLDLRIFDLLYGADVVDDESPVLDGADFVEDGNDTLAGYNVQTIALQVPASTLALNGAVDKNPVIGVWSDTERPIVQVFSRTDGGGGERAFGPQVQVSRLGNPLVNEVVIPLKDKDKFNASTPQQDEEFLQYVQDPIVPELFELIYGVPALDAPRTDLVEVFLTGICAVEGCPDTVADVNLNSQLLNADVNPATFQPSEMLRLNMSIPPAAEPNRLGVLENDLAGFPNGRRLIDDVVDIELQVLEGELVGRPNALGDAVPDNDVPFTDKFPYVGLPHFDAVNLQEDLDDGEDQD
ncbi:DUF4331 domain-containing protein [Blastococcus capsensis]|uniref:DUF4331 domain-containing protein n=1 Tax=Blastococcus capsensis TaxID=1564163 RepID=UPI0025406D1B|nr:DUF4331 domain-containing protein [Blastococcus capsensis]MDK3257754.1 DUF4331 domain-containing protein [Blastococcus capsensis]